MFSFKSFRHRIDSDLLAAVRHRPLGSGELQRERARLGPLSPQELLQLLDGRELDRYTIYIDIDDINIIYDYYVYDYIICYMYPIYTMYTMYSTIEYYAQ